MGGIMDGEYACAIQKKPCFQKDVIKQANFESYHKIKVIKAQKIIRGFLLTLSIAMTYHASYASDCTVDEELTLRLAALGTTELRGTLNPRGSIIEDQKSEVDTMSSNYHSLSQGFSSSALSSENVPTVSWYALSPQGAVREERRISGRWGGKLGALFPSLPDEPVSELQNTPLLSQSIPSVTLATHLEFLKDVESINLSGNALSPESGPFLLALAQQNPNLCEINLDNNYIPAEIVDQIKAQLKKNRTRKEIERESIAQSTSASWLEDITFSQNYSSRCSRDERSIRYGLSIDGGGMKGVIPATFLLRMQGAISRYAGPKRTIKDIFSGYGGSSIGGVLALALTKREPLVPEKLVKLFTKKGKQIFEPSLDPRAGIFQSRYQSQGLENIFKKSFGERERLSEIAEDKILIITGVRTDLPEGLTPYLFDSQRARRDSNSDFLLKDVARATAAAPTYFPRATIRDCSPQRNLYQFWDGGLWKNDSAELLLNTLIRKYPEDRIKIFSLGTGQSRPSYESIWADGIIGNISPLLMGQMDLSANVSSVMNQRIGVDYRRLQPLLLDSRGAFLTVDMDNTSREVLDRYQELANDFWGREGMDEFVRHICEDLDFSGV